MSRSITRGLIVALAVAGAPLIALAQTAPPAAKRTAPAHAPAAAKPMALAAGYDPSLYSGLKYRMIGPLRGGRVTAVTGVASNPQL
jgi:hypothetical protein